MTISYVRPAQLLLCLLLLMPLLLDCLRSRFCVLCCCSASDISRTQPSAAPSLSTTKNADLAVYRTIMSAHNEQKGDRNTHREHDEFLCALPLDTRDHPACLVALRPLLTARRR